MPWLGLEWLGWWWFVFFLFVCFFAFFFGFFPGGLLNGFLNNLGPLRFFGTTDLGPSSGRDFQTEEGA